MENINYEQIFGQVVSYDMLEKQEALENDSTILDNDAAVSVIEKYQDLLARGEAFEYTFSGITKKSALFSYEDGVRVMLPLSIMGESMKETVAKGRTAASELVGKPVWVKVSSIKPDGEYGPIIFLRSNIRLGAGHSGDSRVSTARRALNDMVDGKDKTKIPARVVMVDLVRRLITLDIGGYGIKAYCRANDWGVANITDVTLSSIKAGSVVGVRVVGKPIWRREDGRTVSKSKIGAYRCVRLTDAPYKGLSDRFPVGTVVVARLEKAFTAYGFFAIDGFSDVHIMCYYPWLRDKGWSDTSGITKVYEGVSYKICVTEVDEHKKLFRGRIVGEVPMPAGVVENGRVVSENNNGE